MAAMLASLLEWLWNRLPDNCEIEGCSRQGVRGNENIIDEKIVCDFCHIQQLLDEEAKSD